VEQKNDNGIKPRVANQISVEEALVVSLPFKLIFFVLVDGWSLVAGSLVQSYGG
jgi:type III secretory pathway component EscR